MAVAVGVIGLAVHPTIASAAPGDGGPADEARLLFPTGVAADGAGGFFVADTGHHVVRHVDHAGIITTVAPQLALRRPAGVAVYPDGAVAISDADANRVWRVSADGSVELVAGRGTAGFSGDGGVAVGADLDQPAGLAVTPGGALLVADMGNDRIRRIARDGTIDTVAGGPDVGSLDAGPAALASLNEPSDVAALPNGDFVIADTGDNVVRRVSYGSMYRIAGTGNGGFEGDGSVALQGNLNTPRAVAVAPGGGVYIADAGNQRVRYISPSGELSTVVGSGDLGLTPTGDADGVALAWPSGVAVSGDGSVLASDTSANVVVRRNDAGTAEIAAGVLPPRLGPPTAFGRRDRLRAYLERHTITVGPRCRLRMTYTTDRDGRGVLRLRGHSRPRWTGRLFFERGYFPDPNGARVHLRRGRHAAIFVAFDLHHSHPSRDGVVIRVATGRCR